MNPAPHPISRDRIDAGGTRLRLRALHVMGHGSARLARALGVRPQAIAELVSGHAATVSPQLPVSPPGERIEALARWVAAQPQGNRNAGLYWAANRALEADPAADLSPLAIAARQAGLTDLEITRTLNSGRHTTTRHPQAEAT